MWDIEARSLVALCVECIVDHMAASAPHISSLPQELQSLINAQIQIGTGSISCRVVRVGKELKKLLMLAPR